MCKVVTDSSVRCIVVSLKGKRRYLHFTDLLRIGPRTVPWHDGPPAHHPDAPSLPQKVRQRMHWGRRIETLSGKYSRTRLPMWLLQPCLMFCALLSSCLLHQCVPSALEEPPPREHPFPSLPLSPPSCIYRPQRWLKISHYAPISPPCNIHLWPRPNPREHPGSPLLPSALIYALLLQPTVSHSESSFSIQPGQCILISE